MAVNIIMSYFNNIALIMDLFFVSLVLTHPHKNGKAEHKIRTIKNMIHTMLAHSSVPPRFGIMLSTWQLICQILFPAKHFKISH